VVADPGRARFLARPLSGRPGITGVGLRHPHWTAAPGLHSTGMIELDENDLRSASRRFARVLERDPKHAGALTGMGRIEFQQKNDERASDLRQRAIAADSSLRRAHYYLGMTYGRLGRRQESESEPAPGLRQSK
jgi:tetratricopeptide (TPR) repeat protein